MVLNGYSVGDVEQISVDVIPLATNSNGTNRTCIKPRNIPEFRFGSAAMNIRGLPFYSGSNTPEVFYYDPDTNTWPRGNDLYEGERVNHAVVSVAEDEYWLTGNYVV